MLVTIVLFLYRRPSWTAIRHAFCRQMHIRRAYRRLFSVGLPVAVQMGLESASFTIAVLFVGRLGDQALAAHQIVLRHHHARLPRLLRAWCCHHHPHQSLQAARQTRRSPPRSRHCLPNGRFDCLRCGCTAFAHTAQLFLPLHARRRGGAHRCPYVDPRCRLPIRRCPPSHLFQCSARNGARSFSSSGSSFLPRIAGTDTLLFAGIRIHIGQYAHAVGRYLVGLSHQPDTARHPLLQLLPEGNPINSAEESPCSSFGETILFPVAPLHLLHGGCMESENHRRSRPILPSLCFLLCR